ncbi:hypothetical protein VC_1230 [Vibrio cholerae O1 biovar El Tor str. N16961]|uniref:Uncharacterized protein n=2 Tax=Vibrio cholerae TaxID=666 RepID=Q9KSM6_VIBCH|nr:hypothetical protein VC_1230 [Vibrio cholerae O1 biovar El Tor str. N16961]ACP05502.1 conserved hypothetical protein [Vibrio cholerae M66-2]
MRATSLARGGLRELVAKSEEANGLFIRFTVRDKKVEYRD